MAPCDIPVCLLEEVAKDVPELRKELSRTLEELRQNSNEGGGVVVRATSPINRLHRTISNDALSPAQTASSTTQGASVTSASPTSSPVASVVDPRTPPVTDLATLQRLAQALVGRWVVVIKRSDPFEELFKALGIAWMKRKVMNSAVFPISIDFKKDDARFLHIIAHLPVVSERLMVWRLDGETFPCDDPDCGVWTAKCQAGPYPIDGSERPHMALQNVREHDKLGSMIETRRIIADKTYGNMLHIEYRLRPKNGGKDIVVQRYLKQEGVKTPKAKRHESIQ
ncbi:unnamed protein product [Vitrella brassicaformis CCMP3155]|uniref:Uncharacterized protein n=2 Tax=Vitrella brassicaformis TaxID=1169539 RepID=A0A0G4GRD9_VITBC|nr:unnamed protein product [Vitrella brassicaformis CCMP3155]|mmetsp:Transcript_8507/g.20969  ORF Transcript_8507/g.20969 Transcript_8507/m.20969 type:complete len:282 (+) Transcript_8507:112-957(+)|eukprot:CEM33100.1 unnamed protein product [Vitrella brassicaformis CCMP3155]